MLDALLAKHLLVQVVRIAAAASLFYCLYAIGAAILRIDIVDRTERLLLRVATGFAVYQCIIRWAGELPLLTRAGIWTLTIALAAVATIAARRTLSLDRDSVLCAVENGPRAVGVAEAWQTEAAGLPPIGRSVLILLLLLSPLVMALAPAASQDALIYHLRFPEMTLQDGRWAYDTANSSSYHPAATGTLYVAALAVDPQGVTAQLVHFGFFVLSIAAAAAIARRLGATSGHTAALLVAAVPCAGIVGGWAWADLSLTFAIAAAALAALGGMYAIALILLALAASIKYTALLACLPIALAIVAAALRARRGRRLAVAVALAAVIASPWYATNALRTGNPVYPLATSLFGGTASGHQSMAENWSRIGGKSWGDVWSGYFLEPQTLDEDVGGLLFLAIAALGLGLALRWRAAPLRIAAFTALAMWAVFLPLTSALRLLLPAVAATLIVAGAAFEQMARARKAIAVLTILFALRGGLIVASHNAHFMNPLPAAVGIEKEADYLARNFPPAALYARLRHEVPPDARFLAINEVRLFRFPRPVTAPRVFDPPLLARYIEGAQTAEEILQRLRRDGVTHLLLAAKPIERGPAPKFSPRAESLFTELLRGTRAIDREGTTIVLELPASMPAETAGAIGR